MNTEILVRKWMFKIYAVNMEYANKTGNMSITGVYTGNKIRNGRWSKHHGPACWISFPVFPKIRYLKDKITVCLYPNYLNGFCLATLPQAK